MRLYLAVAVLMLAFVAYTEAQDQPEVDTLAQIGTKVKEISETIAERAKTAFEEVKNSDIAVKTMAWFSEQFGRISK